MTERAKKARCPECGRHSTVTARVGGPCAPCRAANADRRRVIIRRMHDIRDECQSILDTADHWNRAVRKPDEAPIDVDHDGRLRRMIAAYNRVLRDDTGHGPIAAPVGIWDGESHETH